MNKEQLIAKCKEIDPDGKFEFINCTDELTVLAYTRSEFGYFEIANSGEIHLETDVSNLKILNKKQVLDIIRIVLGYFERNEK